MEGEKSYNLTLLFEMPQVELYDCDSQNKSSRLIQRGNLGVYELPEMKLFVLVINDWKYSLSKQVPVMLQEQPNNKSLFILPKQSGSFGLYIDPKNSDLYDCWLSILSNNSDLVQSQIKVEQTQITEQSKQEQPKKDSSTSEKIGNFLSQGGSIIRGGLITGAKLLQQGIVSAGQYISQHYVTKPEPKKVSEQTYQKVKMANVASKGMLVYTQTQITALIKGAEEIGGALAQEISNSETGQKVQQHKYYPDAKNIAKGTFYGVASIYDGMYEAICCIGRGIQSASSEIVSKKYGQDAGKVVNEGLDAVGNVGQMAQAYKDVTVKEIIKNQEKK